MSKRAARFVRDWIEDNIHADEHQKSDPKAIVLLALRCIDDAARKGISVRDLHKTFGNLIEYMTQAIEK